MKKLSFRAARGKAAKVKISAVIPVFNAEKYLARAVQSLIDTKYGDLEIIIVDDGSSDSSLEVAHHLAAVNSKVAVFRHADGGNHGVSTTRNLGLAKCQGDLICFLDADDYVFPHRFDVAVSLLESDDQVDGVHELARMEFEQGKGPERFWGIDEMFGIRAKSMELCSYKTLLTGICWNPGCILVRKELLKKAGGFPEDHRFAEDYHLWLRMVCVGRVVAGNDTEPVSVYYRHSENTYKGGLERKVDVIRAMTDVYRQVADNQNLRVNRVELVKPICDYINHTLIRAREEHRCDIGRKTIRTVFSNGFSPALFDSRVRRQMAWVLIGRNAKAAGHTPEFRRQ